jgi:CYTH domain-containing protein
MRQIEGHFPERECRSSSVLLNDRTGVLVVRYRHQNGFTEERTEVPQPHAQALLDVTAGEIDYVRTTLSIGSRDIVVDQLTRPEPLPVITVGFETEAEAWEFHPLPWFGPEVTTDHRYSFLSLAIDGIPDTREAEPSNAALGSLLDTLENRFADVWSPQHAPINQPAPKQARTPEAPPQSGGPHPRGSRRSHQASLDDVQAAMLQEMERARQGQWPH